MDCLLFLKSCTLDLQLHKISMFPCTTVHNMKSTLHCIFWSILIFFYGTTIRRSWNRQLFMHINIRLHVHSDCILRQQRSFQCPFHLHTCTHYTKSETKLLVKHKQLLIKTLLVQSSVRLFFSSSWWCCLDK